ncbi:MAG: RNA polymerase Rpb4 family protein [Desulfurococcales archaeon]|nr:RNA polymerase Rpb4 family protein [Desulfurococcales archaeon]
MPKRIESVRNVTWAEAKELIEKRMAEGATTIHHDRVYQYLETFALMPAEEARKLVSELMEKVGLDEEVAVVVANICPVTPGEVRSILEMRREVKYDEETVKKTLEVVEKYCGVPSE